MARGFGWAIVAALVAGGAIGLLGWPVRLSMPLAFAAELFLPVGFAGAWYLTRRKGTPAPSRAPRVAVGSAMLALAFEAFAYLVLTYADVVGNSWLWFPLNVAYFGGIALAGSAVVLAIFAGLEGSPRAGLWLVAALAAVSVMLFRVVPYR